MKIAKDKIQTYDQTDTNAPDVSGYKKKKRKALKTKKRKKGRK